MAKAAPFTGDPFLRIAAAVADFLVCLFIGLFLGGISYTPSEIDGALVLTAKQNVKFFVVYFLYHAACYRYGEGQTFGLWLLRLRLVDARDGASPSLLQMLTKAGFRPFAIYAVAFAMAPNQSPFVLFVAALLSGEITSMFALVTRQSVSDVVSRTMVIKLPPPEPHRAPAGPMYSEDDSEFGVRPRRHKRLVAGPPNMALQRTRLLVSRFAKRRAKFPPSRRAAELGC